MFNYFSKHFKKKDTTSRLSVLNQGALKEKLAEVLPIKLLSQLDKLMDYMGDPPDISKIPHDYLHSEEWLTIQKQVEPILVEIGKQNFIASFSSDDLETTNNGVIEYEVVDWDHKNATNFQDWTKSPAHLELLSKFSTSQFSKHTYLHTKDDFPTAYRACDWEAVLKEPQLLAIRRFINEGYLIRPDLFALIDYKFTVPDLKKLCQQRGLKVSAKKADLIEKLIEVDKLGMMSEVDDLEVFTYSEKGESLAHSYLESRHKERETALSISQEHLRRRNYRQALITRAEYQLNQVFQSGLGVDWKKESVQPNDLDIQTLNIIFEETPTILTNINQVKLDQFRVFAGFDYLWGSKEDLRTLLVGSDRVSATIENLDIVRSIISFSINRRNINLYREHVRSMEWSNNTYTIKINTCNDEQVCDVCKKLAVQTYPVFGEVPELPFPECSHVCRCSYALDRQLSEEYY